LAAEFLRALDATIAAVERNPDQFPQVHGEKRRALLRRFPYGVIFSVSDEAT
jgi:toxin ParE1/3/4